MLDETKMMGINFSGSSKRFTLLSSAGGGGNIVGPAPVDGENIVWRQKSNGATNVLRGLLTLTV